MDTLSEALRVVALKGALYYNAEFSAPWSVKSPPAESLAAHFGPDTGHVIVYHLLTEGRAWAQVEGGEREDLAPGDIVIFPHGDAHTMGNGAAAQAVDGGKELERVLSQGVEVVRAGGGGEVTKFVCGYMICESNVSRTVLGGLPPLLKINIRKDASGAWLESSIRFSVANGTRAAGAEAVCAKLSEALFVETLRRCAGMQPAAQTGWLAGARDPEVGRALGLLHRQPGRSWTIGDLASSVGLSRAVLAERFRRYVGEAPIGYLLRWRLQLSARMLRNTSQSVAEIAGQVGYDSEAAFNRAFKRRFGAPPARFRREARAA